MRNPDCVVELLDSPHESQTDQKAVSQIYVDAPIYCRKNTTEKYIFYDIFLKSDLLFFIDWEKTVNILRNIK